MADPEDFGSWLNATQDAQSVALPKLPDPINSVISGINSTISFLQSLLDIALIFLDVVKTFAVGFIDPILALIDAILDEIEALLIDLRSVGIYFTGDWYLTEYPYEKLLGGFQAFETRTLGRFLDRTDPTRPDIPSTQAVLAIFLYHSSSIETIARLVRFLSQLVTFFNFDINTTKTTQTPSDLRVEYGVGDEGFQVIQNPVESISQSSQNLDVAHVSWGLSSPVFRTPLADIPSPPPHGFLVEVSTVRDGLPVFYDRPLASSPTVDGPGSTKVQDRESGQVLDPQGNPFVLYGGLDTLEIPSNLQYNNAMAGSGEVKPGSSRVWVQKTPADSIPIPIEELVTSSDQYLLQRTFFVQTDDLFGGLVSPSFLQRARYSIDLPITEMPFDAEFEESGGQVQVKDGSLKRPNTYYVRVSVVSEAINDAGDFKYLLDGATVNVPGKPFRAKYADVSTADFGDLQLSRADKGEPSEALEVNYPSSSSKAYIDLLTTALAVLVLSRSDLEVGDDVDEFEDNKAATSTGLEQFSALIPQILNVTNPNDYFDLADEDTEYSDVYDFRASILEGCQRVASELYRTSGVNPDLEADLQDRASILLDFSWDQSNVFEATRNQGAVQYTETILSALEDSFLPQGLARNPEAAGLGIFRGTMEGSIRGVPVSVADRTPGFYQRQEGDFTIGSADRSPCLTVRFNDGSFETHYVRNLFPSEVYTAARQVLGVSTPVLLKDPRDGAWISLRLGQLFPSLEGVLDTILEWARSIRLGAESIVDAVLAYIEFLEARILELQNLLNRIEGLTEDIIPIRLPQFSSLFLLGNGTDDIISQFTNADNKPVDGISDYGGGAVVLAAGPPAFVVDLLVDFLSE